MKDRIVLTCAGGLDTSGAIGRLGAETGAEVVADVRDEHPDEPCLPAVQADALDTGRYPLVSAISRPMIVEHLVAARDLRLQP